MTPEPERERIEEIVQIFQYEYGQYTSLEALSIASDWLRNTLHQELQKARHQSYALAVKHLKEAYEANGATTVPEAIEWLEDNVRLHQSELDQPTV